MHCWLLPLVKLRNNLLTAGALSEGSSLSQHHITLLRRVRLIANSMRAYLLSFVPRNTALLSEFVREIWPAGARAATIEWTQVKTSEHVFLGNSTHNYSS